LKGFLNIDKPQGMTSFDVIRRLRKILPPKTKMGHLGTLDPMAAGVLPVAVGPATRIIEYIQDERKIYTAEMTLGGISDTEDAWGNIEYTGNTDFAENNLMEILNSFIGKIQQVPPMYSAVHYHGKRLYELARQGVQVDRPAREIEIYAVKLISINRDTTLPCITFEVECSRGTYVRSLCHDIGEQLRTGAYLSGLIRKQSGIFAIEDSCGLQFIIDNPGEIEKLLHPVDYPLQQIPGIELSSDNEERMVMNGNSIVLYETLNPGMVKIYSRERHFMAVGEIQFREGKTFLHPKKVLMGG